MNKIELINKDFPLIPQNGTGSKRGGNINFFVLRRLELQNSEIKKLLRHCQETQIEAQVRLSDIENLIKTFKGVKK